MRNGKEIIKRAAALAERILLAGCLLFILLCFFPKLAGIEVGVIKSGSMEPSIQTGSLLYFKRQPGETVCPGDVAVFAAGSGLTAHRVQCVYKEKQQILTKGDNNDSADAAPVPFRAVQGKALFAVPGLGYALSFLQSHRRDCFAVFFSVMILKAVVKYGKIGKDKKCS